MLSGIYLATVVLVGGSLENGAFEAKGDGVPGWEISEGAIDGALEPQSVVEVQSVEKKSGRRSLHFVGTAATRRWMVASQEVEARPGGLYRISGYLKTRGLKREGAQRDNCYLAIFLFDGVGELVARDVRSPEGSDSPWQRVDLEVLAPDSVRRVEVKAFLSKTGELWVDDLDLAIEGGEPVPAPVEVFLEDFEEHSEVPPEWVERVGARNGDSTARSSITIDRRMGAGDSERSLLLEGNAGTVQWYELTRRLPVAPGDAMHLCAMVKARDVRREAIQFTNLHVSLTFQDSDGETIGSARHGLPGLGYYDWKPVEIRGVAPEGAESVLVGLFLSLSGSVWFDDVRLTRQPGSTPAYAGWMTTKTRFLTLRYPPDHPEARDMSKHARRMEVVYKSICRELELVGYKEPITVFIYRDDAQGYELTGRELAFASPESRTVHQTTRNTLGHELAHVIALELGYAQAGLLGEGLAVYLNGAKPREHHELAASLLEEGELPTVGAMLADFRAEPNGYPAAGSFCGFLIETHGMNAFRRLYPLADPNTWGRKVLGSTLEDLDGAWREFLADY